MWPFRAVERVALRLPQSPGPDQRVLVTLRALSPMNYFRMSAEEVRELWPDAELVQHELEYGVCLCVDSSCLHWLIRYGVERDRTASSNMMSAR